jgi:alpha-galactosidase
MKTVYSLPITTPADMDQRRAWVDHFFANAADLPISFTLNGETIRGIPSAWQPVVSRRRIDANLIETVFEGRDPQSGLQVRVECTEYRDYPVIEWVAWLTNQGSQPTPLISDLLALDGTFRGAAPVLDHCNGDFYSETGYTPEQTPVPTGETLRFAPNGGRPCDGAFPYYRLHFQEGGLALAIGWPAQWAASFQGVAEGVQVQAGQEQTHLRLLPGERIRTPRITVLTWAGDASRAVNLWRRWVLAHILPRPNGQPMKPLLVSAATEEGEEFTAATTENQIYFVDRFRQQGINFDVWWIDAGWYPCYNAEGVRRWPITGTWEPDAERFPTGLKPISDRVAQQGASLLLWFEPERVRPGTKLDQEHPEWLLTKPDSENRLLNLGDPACRQWLTDHICGLIQANGIKIYRQDFNFPPLDYWRKNEADDRQGMIENLHVQGYLQFWDDLLDRNPGLWIDSCSSGGRRNDLETLRRSVPLHYTDYGYGDHPVKLAFQRTMYEWTPYFKEVTLAWDRQGNARFDHEIEAYGFHCGMAPMLFVSLDIRRDDYDFALARQLIGVWRKAADLLLYGDYYPHTPFHRSPQEWVARQFDSPETGCGLLHAIRLPAAAAETLTIHPQGIHTDATYTFENPESGETRTVDGATLSRDGFTFALPPRSGALWLYRKQDQVLS